MSTNVLWAGNVFGNTIVSIFNNPTGQEGSNLPLISPYEYLDRIYLDTRFKYLNTIWQTTFTQNFGVVQATGVENFGDRFTTVAFHNLGYTPVAILIDSDTRESINSGNFIQVVDNVSYRNISLLMDSTKFYIKEKYYTKDSNLPSITRRFTILAFSNSADLTPPISQNYSFASIPTSINEGNTGTFNITTANVSDNTIVYWTIATNSGDFSNTNGSFTVTSNSGSFVVTPTADLTTEGSETFTVYIRADSISGTVVAVSTPVTINDTSTSPIPSYSFASIPTSINEGSSDTFNITTANVSNGTTLYWTISTNSGDFGTTSGSFNITSNVGSFSVTPTADLTTEGSETFTVSIRTGSITGTVVKTSNTITINDTSITPIPSYSFASVPTSINEGNVGNINVTTANISNGTTLYWTLAGNTGDFGTTSGSFSITSNVGAFNVTPTADSSTEGAETFTISIRTGSISGNVVATSNIITINDTSLNNNTISYSFASIPTSIDEGNIGTLNVVTTNVANGTTLYWTIATNSADFTEEFSSANTFGSFNITSNAGSFNVSPSADRLTEGSNTFTVAIRTNSTTGNIVATSNTIIINDTSNHYPYTYAWGAYPTSINEGNTATFNIITTGYTPGSNPLTWTRTPYTDTSYGASGNFYLGANIDGANDGSFTLTPTLDHIADGPETFRIYIRRFNNYGPIVLRSNVITVNDTSNV